MLDLGTSFIASVARDPDALAHRRRRRAAHLCANGIGASPRVVAGLDALGLKPGDHIVTALQNRQEAATLHWACQFAGIIITPVNWRATADDLDFFCQDAEREGAGLRRRVGRGGARLQGARAPRVDDGRLSRAGSTAEGARRAAARRCRGLVGDALHLGHHGAAEGRAAPPARRARRRARACGAEHVSRAASARSA